jgi:hypothetical protein
VARDSSGSTISIAVFAGLTGIVISGTGIMMDSEGIAASEDSMATAGSAAGIERSAVGSESSTAGTESSVGSGVSAVEAREAFTAVTAPSRPIAGSTAVKAAGVSFMVEGVAAMVVADPTAAQLMDGK